MKLIEFQFKVWHRPLIAIIFYLILITILFLPIWVPHDWRVLREASEPAVKAIYSPLWEIWLAGTMAILAILGCMKIANITDWLASRFFGKKPVDCLAIMMIDLMKKGFSEDDAHTIVLSWYNQFKISER